MLCSGNTRSRKTWLAPVRKNTMVCRVGEEEVGALEDEAWGQISSGLVN